GGDGAVRARARDGMAPHECHRRAGARSRADRHVVRTEIRVARAAGLTMTGLILSDVRKSYGNVVAVANFNLAVDDREFVVLVGPAGCGKSTTLRMIAGLEALSGGTIAIGGRVVNHLQPKDRDVAMVFQNYALYPHMSVRDNLGFGLRNRRTP